MVAAGIGVALVPLLTVDPSDDRIAVVDLGDRVPARLIGVAWHRDRLRTPAAERVRRGRRGASASASSSASARRLSKPEYRVLRTR